MVSQLGETLCPCATRTRVVVCVLSVEKKGFITLQ